MASRRTRGTREALLEAAGQVFAERGVDGATGKEICRRAGTNAAAVNYYFGGIEGLYAATLVEAHHRLIPIEAMAAAAASASTPAAKLRAVIHLITEALVGPRSSTWVFRVLSRELLAPSGALGLLRQRELIPKARILRGIVGELMQLPEDHPAVARACINVLAPCVFLLIGDRRTILQAFPGLGLTSGDASELADHFVRYAIAGMAAVAETAGVRGQGSGVREQTQKASRGAQRPAFRVVPDP